MPHSVVNSIDVYNKQLESKTSNEPVVLPGHALTTLNANYQLSSATAIIAIQFKRLKVVI